MYIMQHNNMIYSKYGGKHKYINADTAHMYIYSTSNQNFILWVTVWDIPCLVHQFSFRKQAIKIESINGTLWVIVSMV